MSGRNAVSTDSCRKQLHHHTSRGPAGWQPVQNQFDGPVSRARRHMLTMKRPLSWLGGVLAAVSSLVLLSMVRSRRVSRTAAVPVPEDVPSLRPPANEPESSTPSGTTAIEHADAKPKTTATLSELLADNHTLLEVIGVFAAVSVFTGQLRIRWFAYTLSFLFMTLVVILCVELRTKLPFGTDSVKVMLFEDVLTAAVVLLLLDFFVDYRNIWKYFLFLPIFGVIFCVVLLGFVVPVLRAAIPRNKALRRLVGLAISIIVAYFSLRLAALVEPSVNRFLDALNKLVSGWTD